MATQCAKAQDAHLNARRPRKTAMLLQQTGCPAVVRDAHLNAKPPRQALRDRDFKINEDNVRQWRVHVEKLLKEVGMAECGWKGKEVVLGEGGIGRGRGRRRGGGLEELGGE